MINLGLVACLRPGWAGWEIGARFVGWVGQLCRCRLCVRRANLHLCFCVYCMCVVTALLSFAFFLQNSLQRLFGTHRRAVLVGSQSVYNRPSWDWTRPLQGALKVVEVQTAFSLRLTDGFGLGAFEVNRDRV